MKRVVALAVLVSLMMAGCAELMRQPGQAALACGAGGAIAGAAAGAAVRGDWTTVVTGAVVGALLAGTACFAIAEHTSRQVHDYDATSRTVRYEPGQGDVVRVTRYAITPAAAAPGTDVAFDATYHVMTPTPDEEVAVTETRIVKLYDPSRNSYRELGRAPRQTTVRPGTHRAEGKFQVGSGVREGKYLLVFEIAKGEQRDAKQITLQVTTNQGVLDANKTESVADGTTETVVIPPPDDAPQQPTPRPGERWAVIIGIDKYQDASIASLRYAAADARAVHEFLVTKGGFRQENTVLLLNREATEAAIRRALGEFLKSKALKDDEVVIYYAGHGTTEPDASAEGGLAKYLVPYDANPESLYSTAIPMTRFDEIFARIQARKILLVQDTCFSGGAGGGGRTFLRKGIATRSLALTDRFLRDLSQREGRMILTASDANQLSQEMDELKHGVFTYYLLQGLEGDADLDKDGAVTVRELHLYLQRKVHEKSGGNQTPQLYNIGDMVLIRK